MPFRVTSGTPESFIQQWEGIGMSFYVTSNIVELDSNARNYSEAKRCCC